MNYGYIPKDDPSYNFIRAERFIDNCALILLECLKNKEDKEMAEKTAFNIKKMKEEENFNFNVKDVLSWSNNQDAIQYIGHKGYFGDSLSELDLAVYNGNIFTLNAVSEGVSQCFFSAQRGTYFGFFLPEDKAKEEKQYRPFTADEFLKLFKVGDVIEIKHPNAGEVITLITSIRKKTNELTLGCLSEPCSFKGCFESGTEIFLNNQWQPFGVEE